MTFVEACRAFVETRGRLPANITIFLEGEEESGSPSLVPFLKEHRQELAADIALVCDTGMWQPGMPSICTSLRGLLGQEIIVQGSSRDLHSGAYGGPAANLIRVLIDILASLHDDTGRVTIPGFYDGVPDTPAALKDQWDALGFSTEAFLGAVGLSHPADGTGFTALEMLWSRPTCDCNGITGYAGDGLKTVLPAEARAKVSCLLVGSQDPFAIREAFQAQVRTMVSDDCSVTFLDHCASPGLRFMLM